MKTAPRRPGVDPRLRDRRRAVAADRRSRRRRLTVLVAAVVVAAIAAAVVASSPLLEVDSIEVEGVEGRRAEQVRERLTPTLGRPLVRVDRDARAATISRLPWVRRTEVRRRLPGTVVAEVQARQPIVAVETERGRWQVDADAVVVAAAGDADDGLIAVRAGEAAVVAAPGERLRDDTLRQAVEVARQLPGDLAARVTAVRAHRPRALALELDAGVVVRLGSAERLPAKLDSLELVVADLMQRGSGALDDIDEIDVRVPENPTVRRADRSARPEDMADRPRGLVDQPLSGA